MQGCSGSGEPIHHHDKYDQEHFQQGIEMDDKYIPINDQPQLRKLFYRLSVLLPATIFFWPKPGDELQYSIYHASIFFSAAFEIKARQA